MNTLTTLFLIVLTLSYTIQWWLSRRQITYVAAHRDQVPEAFQATVPLSAHQKAADYTIDKSRLGKISSALGLVLLLSFTFGGGINALADFWGNYPLGEIGQGIALILSVFLISYIIELPISIYQTFVLEENYGFNRSTARQFAQDQLLQITLTCLIGGLLLGLILWVMSNTGNLWWLLAWAVLMSFSLLMSWIFPTLIAPLFNKFTPLQNEALKQRIDSLLQRCGFNSKGIFVMDGSRRSGHGNAYFTGIGNNKRIVFFDTLVETLEEEELEAVLAHELGHFKRKHVIKMLAATAAISLGGLALLGWLAQHAWFYHGLGVAAPSSAAALLLFMLVSPIFTIFLQPITAFFQRRHEFEADDFASHHTRAAALISALVKLYRDNASTLTPDPLYSAFHYSHPPAAIRIANLQKSA